MKTVIKLIAVVFLIGGVMGLVKGIFSQMDWLSFRSLLGAGSAQHDTSLLLVERIYGIVMAALEVLIAVLLLICFSRYLKPALTVIGVNALGCAAAVIMGDLFAIVSLLIRIAVIFLLIYVRRREMAAGDRQSEGVKKVMVL